MKSWSTIVLMFFLNFTALPGIAAVLDWELPQTNVVINEEENHTHTFVLYEKVIPKTLNILDFLKFSETYLTSNPLKGINENIHCAPYLSMFSPPPES